VFFQDKEKIMKLKSLLIGAVAVITPLAVPAAVFAGYAPAGRQTYQCVTPSNCPGADHVVFNSFTNAPNYGDERDFLNVRDASSQTWLNNIKVHDGEKLVVRAYVHNNANPNAIGVAAATAHNTKLQVILPTSEKASNTAAAQISASNANPGTVSDTIDLAGAKPFTLAFDKDAPVQVTYRPNGTGDFVTRALPNATFSNDQTMNADLGDWHGCFNYSALITMTVVVHMPTTPTPPVTPPTTPTTPTTPNTPAQPTELVNTGPGDVVAAFAAVSAVSAIAYRLYLSRRLARQ
jgi:hypothetical protein